MRVSVWKRVAAAAALLGGAGLAQGEPACLPADEGGASPLAGRAGRLQQYEQLPEQCLKDYVVQCSAIASRQMLDMGSAASCSIGYEALLKRGFNGDFNAMLAWWRSQRTSDVN